MPKLCQIIAVEQSIKDKYHKFLTQLHRDSNQEHLFNGLSRVYSPKNDGDDVLPKEDTNVQRRVKDSLSALREEFINAINHEATKDIGNTIAQANVEVDGETILEDMPPTFLLALEKKLINLHTYIKDLPVLDSAYKWNFDKDSNVYRTDEHRTNRTSKQHVVITKAVATEHHPAQTEIVTEDKVVGFWDTTKLSGAISTEERNRLAKRVERLRLAVRSAREEANTTNVEKKEIGTILMDYLFTGIETS